MQGNPVGIEFLKTRQKCTINEILSKYFKFITNAVWSSLGSRVSLINSNNFYISLIKIVLG